MKELIINKEYSKSEIMNQMQNFFEKEAFIQLDSFFNLDIKKLNQSLDNLKFNEVYNPMKFKFEEVNLKKLDEKNYFKQIEFFFKSEIFKKFIIQISQFNLELKEIKLKKYSQSDFTIINDEEKEDDSIDIYFDLSNSFEDKMGGILTYSTKEEELFYLKPTFNNLTILFKPDEVIKYLKYINCMAKNKSILRFELKFKFIE